MNQKTALRKITIAAMIAALYTGLTLAISPLGFGPIQFRISEALTVLPFIFPEAIPGIFVGCLISNIVASPYAYLDIIFGSLASLAAAIWTNRTKNKFLAPLPPIILNAVIIAFVITFSVSSSDFSNFNMVMFYTNMATIGLSEAVICYALGLPLITALQKLINREKK